MKKYDTYQICQAIKNFLNDSTVKAIVKLNSVSFAAGLKRNILYDIVNWDRYETTTQNVYRLCVVLRKIGFNVPVKLFEYENEICNAVSEYTGEQVNKAKLHSKTRKREIVLSRQIAMVYRNKKMRLSLQSAGKIYDKDHATVLNAKKQVKNLLDTDPAFCKVMANLAEKIDYDFKY